MPRIYPPKSMPFAQGKLDRGVFPRWRRGNEYCWAAPFKRSPHWLVIQDDGWGTMTDAAFLYEWRPSNQDSRDTLRKIIARRPEAKECIGWK